MPADDDTRAVVVRTQRASVTASSFGPSPPTSVPRAPTAASIIPRSVFSAGSSFCVSVSSPVPYGHRPRRPRRRPSDGPHEDHDTVRYVIEVMGFDDPEYEKDKKDTHSRMRRIGRVIRMEGGQFESSYNGVDRQRERITGQVRKALLWRWKTG